MTIKKTTAILLLCLLIFCVNASLNNKVQFDDLSINMQQPKKGIQNFEYREIAVGMYEDIAGNIIEFTDEEMKLLNLD